MIYGFRDPPTHIGLDFNIIFAIDIAFMVTNAEIQTKACSWGAIHFYWMIVNDNVEFAAVILVIAIHSIAFKAFHINFKYFIFISRNIQLT